MICAPCKELRIPAKLMSPNWEKALAWLKEERWKYIPLGKTEIDGSGLYVNRSSYMTRMRSECRYESHRVYADVQMVVRGVELLLVCFREGLKVTVPYSAENDIDFLEGEQEPVHSIILGSPQAVVLFPWDAHIPSIAPDGRPGEVEKIVLKVAL